MCGCDTSACQIFGFYLLKIITLSCWVSLQLVYAIMHAMKHFEITIRCLLMTTLKTAIILCMGGCHLSWGYTHSTRTRLAIGPAHSLPTRIPSAFSTPAPLHATQERRLEVAISKPTRPSPRQRGPDQPQADADIAVTRGNLPTASPAPSQTPAGT